MTGPMFLPKAIAALALFALAGMSAHAAGCRYTRFATLPVRLEGVRVVLDGSINDTPQTMMIDTGSEDTWIPRKTAEQLSLKLAHSNITSIGTGGESEAFTTMIDDMKIGKVHWRKVHLNVVWEADFPYGAVVGANFLFQNDVEFALQDKEVRFFEPDGCNDTFLAYWDDNAVVVPLHEIGGSDLRPVVDVVINGKKLRALVDSGAPVTTIDLAAAAQLGVTPKTPGTVAVGKIGGIGKHDNDAWFAPFDSFAVGEETINHPKIMMHDLHGALYEDEHKLWVSDVVNGDPPVILGEDFLRAHRILFSVSQRKAYLSYLGGPVFARTSTEEKNPAP
jgi:hypothetical protein